MSNIQDNKQIFDLYVGMTTVLEALCRHLIDARVIDRNQLLEELLEAQVQLSRRGSGLSGSLPAALFSALGGTRAQNGSARAGEGHW
jgi:hypothetical protein